MMSWKPTTLWSNSWHIQKLNLGPLSTEEKQTSTPLTTSYRDRNGVRRCTGKKKQLKDSQIPDFHLRYVLVKWFPISSFKLFMSSWGSRMLFKLIVMKPCSLVLVSGPIPKHLGTKSLLYSLIFLWVYGAFETLMRHMLLGFNIFTCCWLNFDNPPH